MLSRSIKNLQSRLPTREDVRDRLRQWFESATLRLEKDHRDGMRILAKKILHHRVMLLLVFLANLGAALSEGGTIGVLALAVSVLVEDESVNLAQRLGVIGAAVDSLTASHGKGGVFLVLVLAAVTMQIFKSGLAYLGRYFSINLRARISRELQQQATRQIMSFSYYEVGRRPAGRMGAMIGQTESFSALIMTFNQIILTLLMFVVYVGVMIVMSVPLTMSAIVVIAILGVSLSGVMRNLRELGERVTTAALESGRVTYEYLQAPRLLRIFNATKYAEKTMNEVRGEIIEGNRKAGIIKAAINPATDAITITGAGLFLVIGYFAAGEAATSVIPKLILFVYVLNRLMPQVKALNSARMSIANMLPTIKRATEFLRTEDKSYTRRDGVRYSSFADEIRFENVGFRYPNSDVDALADVSFTLRKGETIALVGASGAGKSTLADLMLGLYVPTRGRVVVDGTNLADIRLKDWLNTIGVVDQEIFLLNTSIAENISFASPAFSREDIVNAAKAAYAHDFVAELPDGYDTEIGDRGYRLSGGQRQRLALARALLRDPQMLILDEATSALDTESERIIQRTLEEMQRTRTMLIIAHRLSTLAHANQILVLEHGRVIEQGSWEELLEKSGTFAHLWDMQRGYLKPE